jgi:hypothetical protein
VATELAGRFAIENEDILPLAQISFLKEIGVVAGLDVINMDEAPIRALL